LSFGLPGILFLWLNKKMGWLMVKHTPLFLATWAMLIGIVFVFGTTVVTTFCDGRIIWIAYYPLLLASMVELDSRYKNR
jgi:peptidoglycan/LPS O-acetylase OafA/YrhL